MQGLKLIYSKKKLKFLIKILIKYEEELLYYNAFSY